uniref:Orc1-like AAA ATPase domain-containing protein n=1 Tax=Entomoneis paludosa TaxID=265537 RepID=A0A7S2Y7S1_9STRA|mmetsp:Transcript_21504/g.44851  ORF Transcript_21504/g.44851 Transcript_21504/m.44851 type:complete len:1359 (+) Transcript_21504:236-4312(+)|eukprot:CAMPEP_0172439834 /NCGR_PEP_ID=MMETSP1065-20121228/687_1 /TAXON_ID=265537 /ORGANISM="Amphiprora paludosa, Strain CCMP125" /LENGTH=1358 /DNA_ID=CAMNT_0013188573 /DNA_START=137 /DNA_END=4213 /DNA_ORIENTATION=-
MDGTAAMLYANAPNSSANSSAANEAGGSMNFVHDSESDLTSNSSTRDAANNFDMMMGEKSALSLGAAGGMADDSLHFHKKNNSEMDASSEMLIKSTPTSSAPGTPARPEQPIGPNPAASTSSSEALVPATAATGASSTVPPTDDYLPTTEQLVVSHHQPPPPQPQAVGRHHSRDSSYSSVSMDPSDIPTSSLRAPPSTALTVATPSSHLILHYGDNDRVTLYDREKELGILVDEYTTMVKRASRLVSSKKGKDSDDPDDLVMEPQRNRKLTSVLCIAGKAGTGKTSLARSMAITTCSQSAQQGQKVGYFLFGKCDWPTTSITSTLQAQPHSGDIATSFDATQNQPSLALAFDENEQSQQHEPFAAFAMMLDHLLLQIQARGPVAANAVRVRVREAIGSSGISVVAELSPQLGAFLRVILTEEDDAPKEGEDLLDNGSEVKGNDNGGPPPVVTTTTDDPESKKDNIRVDLRVPRMKYILREFFRSLTADGCPCVLIMDDAQWADQESLQLARHLHSDSENPLFMLILTWRTNDIHEEESCYTAVGSSIGIFADDLVRRINLQNLTQDGTTLLVAEALQMPSSQVIKLAKTVQAKTLGNPFHAKQYMSSLEQEYMLRWSPSRNFWRWDDAKIESMHSTYRAGQLVQERLQKLPQQSLTVLKIVSCLGQAFEEVSASTIIGKIDTMEMFDVEVSPAEAAACFESLVQGGFLERHNARFRTTFIHDQLQESAYLLIPKDSRPLLQLRIGERLLEVMEEHGSDNVSFLGVDLCSKGISFLSSKERMGLALYNLLAGEKCMARSSYASALAYFEYGLSALRVSDFLKGRLSLELSFGAMESAFCVDDFEKVRLHYDRITGSGSNSDDKIRAHVLLIQSTGSRGDPKEAVSTGYRVLRSIGVKSIMEMSNRVSLYVQLTKTKMALRKHTEDTIANLREMGGVKLRQAMRIIEAMLPFAYLYDRQLFMHLVMKSVRWSLKYGVSGQSALVFAALGSFPAFQAMDMSLATICGQAALLLLERFGSHDYPGMVMFLVHSQILNWTTDLPVVQTHLDNTYRVSMESGDVLSAHCSLGASYAIAYESGVKTLEEMENLGEVYSQRLRGNDSESIAAVHDTTWQTVLNLRGENFDAAELTGRAIKNQDEAILLARTSGNELLEFMVLSRQMQLSYLLSKHDRADSLRARSESTVRSVASSPHLVSHVAYCALNSLALCPSNSPASKRNSTHYKTAARLLKKLHHWHDDQGYRYCGPMLHLVQAEFYRVGGSLTTAERSYENAIADADRFGNLREKGLACELLGRFFLRDQQDETWAAHHFDNAMQAYHAWGATVLVNKLLDQYSDILPDNSKASEVSSALLSAKTNETNVV